jgi:catechol 2,3-dioxygenase-like lactoylglutathione lyase family enzyme
MLDHFNVPRVLCTVTTPGNRIIDWEMRRRSTQCGTKVQLSGGIPRPMGGTHVRPDGGVHSPGDDRAATFPGCGLGYSQGVTIKRLDHVSVVVEDLAAAIDFFTALGMTVEGKAPIEGPWVDRVNGMEGVQVDIVMMRTLDGQGRLELTKFRHPELVALEPAIAPPNTPGLRSVMFTVVSLDDTVARLRANGAELIGEVVQYEDKYKLCYLRGPAAIIVALAEELS